MQDLTERRKIWIVVAVTMLLVVFNLYFITQGHYIYALAPVFFVIFALWSIYSMDTMLLAIVFMAPLSVTLSDLGLDTQNNLFIPTEPLLFGILLLFLIKLFYEDNYDKKITYHPISLAIYANLIWIFITSGISTMPGVSFKFLLARLWFVIPFYFFAIILFRQKRYIKYYIWAYILGLSIVIVYTLTRHIGLGLLSQNAAHHVVQPFYRDHTAYGAALAIFLPTLMSFYGISRSFWFKFLTGLLVVVYSFAIVFSYTRAAWVSILGAFLVWVTIKLRVKFIYLFIGFIAAFILLFSYKGEILMSLQENKQASDADLAEHAQSIANVTTDASNLERLNRWSCAWRMFKDQPIFGYGPNTYQFQYAPYQYSYQKTRISTDFGERGDAHSEYLGPLSESGILGLLTTLAIVILSIYYGIRVYRNCQSREFRVITMGVLIGLTTYFIHGILNNFLTTDKASAPFWGFIGIIVAIDTYHKHKTDEEAKLSS